MNTMNEKYPVIEINTDAIANNSRVVCHALAKHGVKTAGVIKFSDGAKEICQAYLDGGCSQLASSRVVHLKDIKGWFPGVPTLLLRIPMICEADEVVEYADYSLNSEAEVIKALSDSCVKLNKDHKVVLMLDIGDRREGVVTFDDLTALAAYAESLPRITVAGVGTNYGCQSGVLPDDENLEMVAEGSRRVEKTVGHKLEIVSACSSSSFIRISQGKTYPAEISHARVGGYIANPYNMRINRCVDIPEMREDTVCLKAMVVESKEKPGVAAGHIGKNWKGETLTFGESGPTVRTIVAVGSQDIADAMNLVPMADGVKVIGGSSDHVVLDTTASSHKFVPGDIIEFRLRYGAMLCAFSTRHITKKYIHD